MIRVSGPVWRRLEIERRGVPLVPLDPSTDDGSAVDAGDFHVTTSFAPFGSARGFSAGALVDVGLPNSDERKGIGPNTTDVTLALLASWGGRAWRGTGSLGVAILEAPLESFEQNDLLAWAFDLAVHAAPSLLVSGGLEGLVNTRGSAPAATGGRGTASAGIEWSRGEWRLDASLGRRIAGPDPEWSFRLGTARALSTGGRR